MPPFNRVIMPRHVDKLVKSVQEMGIVRALVTTVNEDVDGQKKRWILDGNHLYLALVRLGLPVYYVDVPTTDVNHMIHLMAMLNTSSKGWKLTDYVKCWAYSGNSHYQILLKLQQMHNYGWCDLSTIYNEAYNHSSVQLTLKTGKYEIGNKERGDQIIKYLEDVFTVIDKINSFTCAKWVRAFVAYYNNETKYNHKELMKCLRKHKAVLLAVDSEQNLTKFFKTKTLPKL